MYPTTSSSTDDIINDLIMFKNPLNFMAPTPDATIVAPAIEPISA